MPKNAQFVLYNDGDSDSVPALVAGKNVDGTLNLVTFPESSPVEHKNSVPEGVGGNCWHEAA